MVTNNYTAQRYANTTKVAAGLSSSSPSHKQKVLKKPLNHNSVVPCLLVLEVGVFVDLKDEFHDLENKNSTSLSQLVK